MERRPAREQLVQPSGGSAEAARFMDAQEILKEAGKLHEVSESLNALAGRNASVAEGLLVLAETVRHSATLLEVMVSLKLGSGGDVEKASN